MQPPRAARFGLAVVLAAALLAGCGATPDPPRAAPTPPASGVTPASPSARPSPIPPGKEVYGFVPYWEMDDGIAAHLAATRLTTIGLFSVTHTRTGALNETQKGYRAITGEAGRRMIREAHERGVRVELVYTSFGEQRNDRLFADLELQNAVIASLVSLSGELGMDGVNVDVELLAPELVPVYAAFVGRMRDAVVAADPADLVSVATGAGLRGAAMAAAAAGAGADRIFLMGYDYRVAGSSPGASSPLDSRDGEKDLAWSLDLFASLGVPAERTLLGLPLYGVTWPVAGPVVGAPETGRGDTWIPRRHLDLLLDPRAVPVRDDVEQVEVYFLGSDGSIGPPASPSTGSPGASAIASATASATTVPATADVTWQAIYVDSPATLAPKMGLARERGLAGVGFWAIGYERGLPGYTDLIGRFAAGEPLE